MVGVTGACVPIVAQPGEWSQEGFKVGGSEGRPNYPSTYDTNTLSVFKRVCCDKVRPSFITTKLGSSFRVFQFAAQQIRFGAFRNTNVYFKAHVGGRWFPQLFTSVSSEAVVTFVYSV